MLLSLELSTRSCVRISSIFIPTCMVLGVGEVQLDGGSLESERQQKERQGSWWVGRLGDSGELGMVYPVLGSCLAAGAGNPSTSKVSELSWTSWSFGLVGSGLDFCSKLLMAIFSTWLRGLASKFLLPTGFLLVVTGLKWVQVMVSGMVSSGCWRCRCLMIMSLLAPVMKQMGQWYLRMLECASCICLLRPAAQLYFLAHLVQTQVASDCDLLIWCPAMRIVVLVRAMMTRLVRWEICWLMTELQSGETDWQV